MTLKNIPLPAIVLANLYKDLLVEPPVAKKMVQHLAGIDYFGGNHRHILLLINNPDTAFLTDQELTFLTDILTACKLSMNDIAIVNVNTHASVIFNQIAMVLETEMIIAAGVQNSVLELPFKIPEFQVQSYQNKKYLFMPALGNVKNDTIMKKKLWGALKSLFSL